MLVSGAHSETDVLWYQTPNGLIARQGRTEKDHVIATYFKDIFVPRSSRISSSSLYLCAPPLLKFKFECKGTGQYILV